MVGQSSKRPDVGRPAQSLDPPPQFGMPDDPINEAPIIRMTVPDNVQDILATGRSIMQNTLACDQRREDTLQYPGRYK